MSGKRISIRARRAVSGYLFILPFIIGFLCFMLLPLVDSFWMSLCRVDVTAGQGFQTTFIGLDNYIRAFTIDPEFNKLLSEEIGVMVTHTIAILVVSFVIAIVLNPKGARSSALSSSCPLSSPAAFSSAWRRTTP